MHLEAIEGLFDVGVGTAAFDGDVESAEKREEGGDAFGEEASLAFGAGMTWARRCTSLRGRAEAMTDAAARQQAAPGAGQQAVRLWSWGALLAGMRAMVQMTLPSGTRLIIIARPRRGRRTAAPPACSGRSCREWRRCLRCWRRRRCQCREAPRAECGPRAE